MTLDGRIATASGESKWISCEESRRRVHKVRRICDAVIVGAGTAVKDKPSLTVRHVSLLPGAASRPASSLIRTSGSARPTSRRPRPARCPSLSTPPAPAAVGPRAAALRKVGCEVVTVAQAAGGVSLRAVLQDLAARGMSRVLVEGGPGVFASLFAEGLADRVMIFVAPKILASGAAPAPVSGPDARDLASALQIQDLQAEPIGPDILIQGRLGEF